MEKTELAKEIALAIKEKMDINHSLPFELQNKYEYIHTISHLEEMLTNVIIAAILKYDEVKKPTTAKFG